MKKVVVSGGFDPVHVGHLQMLEQAKSLGDHLIVILNSDRFLQNKKGYVFMPFKERKKILLGFKAVDKVVKCIDKDNTVIETLKNLKLKDKVDIFANGGDRKSIEDIPESKICNENNIEMVFGIGGGKIQSSSELVKKFLNYREERPWGFFENLLEEKNYKVKKLVILPKEKISFQFHNFRNEKWFVVKGSGKVFIDQNMFDCKKGHYFEIKKQEKHSIENNGKSPLEIIEIQSGSKLAEDDIVRLQDKYGRT
tara:strand:- start:3909 stop:4667 length:759 start_codon:yes stop_codon:yes gene_type:complete